jgi:AmmeMemoRadiSam system protein A
VIDGVVLLRLAREAIEASFLGGAVHLPREPWLQAPGAVFVTLRQPPHGELRGCVGSIEATLPLGEAVVKAARGAAQHDHRFAPLTPSELALVRVEISVLSSPTPLTVANETDACRELQRARPGVILRCRSRLGVFLPKVWHSVEGAEEFLEHLKSKAGLSRTFWSPDIELEVFTCEEFSEADTQTEAI